MTDLELLARDRYDGDAGRITDDDRARLAAGEPLAYIIGWVPFLGLRIELASRPLIPRPETEWWTELLIKRIGEAPLRVLDLCAGSGAVGLAVLARCPNAQVSFGEIASAHTDLIRTNIERNGLDAARADVRAGDLFAPFASERFDIIATNPPYIPSTRALDASVTAYEPAEALFAGDDGLRIIQRIAAEAPSHLDSGSVGDSSEALRLGRAARSGGSGGFPADTPRELWMEADVENIQAAAQLLRAEGAERTDIKVDPYGRERLVLAYY